MTNRLVLRLICSLILFVSTLQAYAASTGTRGGVLLKFNPGARVNAMGDVFTAIADDMYAIHYNPAGLGILSSNEISAMYVNDVMDTDYGFIGGARPLKNGACVGTSIIYFDGGQIDIVGGALAGTRAAQSDFLVNLACGKELRQGFSIGGNVKVFYSTLVEQYHAVALGMDMGGLYKFSGDKLSLGLCLQNIGTGIVYKDTADSMPLALRAGAAWYTVIKKDYKFLTGLDIIYPYPDNMRANAGFEILCRDFFALRMGYKFGYDIDGFTCGIGLKNKLYKIDYGFSTTGELASYLHRISLSMLFTDEELKEILSKEKRAKENKPVKHTKRKITKRKRR